MRVRFGGPAQIEIIDIILWYDRVRPGHGAQFRRRLKAVEQLLAANPRVFGRVRRAPVGHEVRVGKLKKFPYLVHYEVTSEEVIVIAVTHAKTNRKPWRKRL